MRKVAILLSVCTMIFVAGACTLVSNMVHDDEVVARVGKAKLYKSDLEKVIPDLISPEDSALLHVTSTHGQWTGFILPWRKGNFQSLR